MFLIKSVFNKAITDGDSALEATDAKHQAMIIAVGAAVAVSILANIALAVVLIVSKKKKA